MEEQRLSMSGVRNNEELRRVSIALAVVVLR